MPEDAPKDLIGFYEVGGPVMINGVEYRLQQDYLLVELTEPNRVLPSGLILPESAVENHEEALVLGSGPGILCEDGQQVVPFCLGQETVYFPKYCFQALDLAGGQNPRLGIVAERDLVAWDFPGSEGKLAPMNDWLMVERIPGEDRVGKILLPDRAQKSPACGILRLSGPGLLHRHGPLAGVRRPCRWDLGFRNDRDRYQQGFYPGCRVYWQSELKLVVIANLDGHEPHTFVRARDLIAFEPLDE